MPESLSGEKVAEIVGTFFEKFSPELREHFVDSNVVLGLSGLKPQTEFFVRADDEQADETLKREIEALNAVMSESLPEVRFDISSEPSSPSGNVTRRTRMVSIYNLRGYERASRTTKIPGITPFEAKEGWEEWKKWRDAIREYFAAFPEEEQKMQTSIRAGFEKGYPDIANYDFADWVKSGKKYIDLQYAKIPFAGFYEEAQPVYNFRLEHAADPSIESNIREAGEILGAFYKSDFHKQVEPQLASHRSAWVFDEDGNRIMPKKG